MRKDLLIVFFLITATAVNSGAQNTSPSQGFWNQQSFSGHFRLTGLYRYQSSDFNGLEEIQNSLYLLGGIRLNSNSYLWDPDLVLLSLSGEYNPETRNEKYLQIPDRAEVRNLTNLDLRATIFNNKPVTINAFASLNQSYFNREYLTNIKSDNTQWGSIISLNNKIVPLSVSFRRMKWEQQELQTGRSFSMTQSDIEGRISKSFGQRDKSEIIYSHNNYLYTYADQDEVDNMIDRLSLSNSLWFDRQKRYSLSSFISLYDQQGTTRFRKNDIIERLYLQLHRSLRFIGDYSYYMMEDDFQSLGRNRIHGALNHQLYESLATSLFVEYSAIGQTVYDETNLKTGAELNYTKKIPTGGRLNLGYRYYRHRYDMKSAPVTVRVIMEEHVLSDALIVLLNRPYVVTSSVTVKDVTGTVIYQQGLDYIIIQRNNFIELQRVPGGLIADNQAVYVDYNALQPGDYSYDANNHAVSASLVLFERLIEVYYRGSFQDYTNLTGADFLTLNYFNQNIYGGKIDVGFATAGVEYDNYQSNIIPYAGLRYYLTLNHNIRSRLLISANGSMFDYKILDDEVSQQHINLSGKLAYNITQRSKATVEAGYLRQTGRNIDLELLTARAEVSTIIRQLTLRLGVNAFNRQYLSSNFTFYGTYIELVRKF